MMQSSSLLSSKIRLSESVIDTPYADDDADGSSVESSVASPGRNHDFRRNYAPMEDEAEAQAFWRRPSILLVLFVLLPTLFAAMFEYGIASNQYESEAHFIVRGPQQATGASGLSQLLGMSATPTPADAHSVGDYLLSHDALDAVRRRLDLMAIFRPPEADVVTRLWSPAPQRETLLNYYRDHVHATYSTETGITTLTVRAFHPQDAKRLADTLLGLSEARVNDLNARMFRDGLAAANRQVAEAEAKVEDAGRALTVFRQRHRDIDPDRTSTAQIQLAGALQQQAAAARAEFDAMARVLPASAPQYAASARRAHALEAQVDATKGNLAGSDRSIAASMGDFERLRLRQEFAAKSYEAAATSFQTAREQLLKQQLFIVPVVRPDVPERSLYPKRLQTIAIVFFGLLLTFAVGWLILAGMREHAA